MKGWQIFRHALRQVFGNMDGALKISAAPYAVSFLVSLIFIGAPSDMSAMMDDAEMGMSMRFMGIGGLISVLVVIVAGLIVAVGWHRYVLLNEVPGGYMPVIKPDRLWAYFSRAFVLGLIVILCGVLWGVVVGPIFGGMMMGSSSMIGLVVFLLIVQIPIVFVGLRLCTGLPAQALGQNNAILAGWNATKGQSADMISLAVITTVASVIIGLPGGFVLTGILGQIWALVFGWVQMMVGVSLLTTLYGHYIEARPLA